MRYQASANPGFSKSITFPPIKPINLSVGRGYVELSSSAEALRASTELSKKTFLNQQVSVQLASMVDKSSYYDTSSDLVNTRSPAKITAINAEEDIDPKDYIDPKEDVDVGLKKRAQTELARQKIEALKSRENGQSEENRKPDGLATSRQTQSSTQPDELIAASQPATVTQRSWQTSSNTENTMKPPFNIPGLFMASSGQVSSASSNQSTQQSSDVILQTSVKVVPGLQSSDEIGYPRNVFPMPGEPKPAADYLTVPQASAVDVQATTGKTTIKEHRKRQRAVDFLDSPTAKVRRTLGQNEDASVIIEVSEEGTDMESEEDIDMDVDMDIDIDDDVGQNTPPTRDVTYQNTGNDKQTNIRDFPQRDEISNKKKSTSSGLNGTPPKVQTPSKSKEPEDLKIKEKEIELMNRKIAELEQRIKAKQTASRAQTPEKSALVKALPKNLAPLRGVHQQVKSTVLDNTLHDKFDDMVEEQNLKKAAELAEAAKEAEAMKLAESAKEDEAKAAAVKESELAQKATIVEAASVTQHERSINEQHATAIEKEQIDTQLRDAQLRRAEEAVRAAEEEQRRFRRAEIESGLPILDAEVERTKNRLLSLKEQVDNLENEVQKGVEGRRVLMEELIGLSSAPKFPIASIERNYENSAGLQTLTRTGDDIHSKLYF